MKAIRARWNGAAIWESQNASASSLVKLRKALDLDTEVPILVDLDPDEESTRSIERVETLRREIVDLEYEYRDLMRKLVKKMRELGVSTGDITSILNISRPTLGKIESQIDSDDRRK